MTTPKSEPVSGYMADNTSYLPQVLSGHLLAENSGFTEFFTGFQKSFCTLEYKGSLTGVFFGMNPSKKISQQLAPWTIDSPYLFEQVPKKLPWYDVYLEDKLIGYIEHLSPAFRFRISFLVPGCALPIELMSSFSENTCYLRVPTATDAQTLSSLGILRTCETYSKRKRTISLPSDSMNITKDTYTLVDFLARVMAIPPAVFPMPTRFTTTNGGTFVKATTPGH